MAYPDDTIIHLVSMFKVINRCNYSKFHEYCRHLRKVKPWFSYKGVKGSLEDNFMSALKLEVDQLEPLADNCTKVNKH